jgi:hypothetical protein
MDKDQIIEQLRARVASLERTASLGFLLSAVVHEVNNPLSVILIGADTVRQAGIDHPSLTRHLEVLEQQSDRIIEISRQLQGLSRRNLADRQDCDLIELLRISHEVEQILCDGSHACPDLMHDGEPLPVLVDPQQFMQIFAYTCRAACAMCDREPFVVEARREDVPLIAFGPAAEGSPTRPYAVVHFTRGTPGDDGLPLTRRLADFFSEPREAYEVDLMATWEVLRKLSGKFTVAENPGKGVELQLMIPLAEEG